MIFWIVILVAIVFGMMWLMRWNGGGNRTSPALRNRPAGLDVLEERYARGEINRDEYLQKKRDLEP